MAASAAALAADPATTPSDDIQKQLNDLQAKVSQLQDQQKQTDQATINSVLTDAHQRSLNLADSAPFGTNWEAGKFSLRSEDGNYVLHPWFQLQLPHQLGYRPQHRQPGS
jgi:TolA-binding protein